jgi:RHS repeat-associated protein
MLKRILFIAAVLLAQQCIGQTVSYVRTWEAKIPFTDTGTFASRPASEVTQATAYVDGLGRPLQTVIKKGSLLTHNGLKGDLVSPVVYDALGREVQKYLPYVSSDTNGVFKTSPLADQSSFYTTQLSGQSETYFYSNTDVEASPLNRPVKTYAPGNNWVGSGRGVAMQYLNNTVADSVKIWQVNGAGDYSITGAYAAGLLTELHTADEAGNQVVEYKDNQGKVILKKVQAGASPGDSYSGWFCTYYVYDDYNNLRLVIPPKAVAKLVTDSWPSTVSATYYSTLLDELCFRYEYDGKNRMSIKKVPGAAEVWMVYDKWDRLVLTENGNLRSNHYTFVNDRWIFTKYDQWNRPIMTGFYDDYTYQTQEDMQTYVDGLTTDRYETPDVSATGYTTSASFPQVTDPELLNITFYDDYSWTSNYSSTYATRDNSNDGSFFTAGNTTNYAQAITQSTMTKGMVTGSVNFVLNTSNSEKLVSSVFYDDRGRAIQSKMSNITGGTDITTTQYNFSGQPLMTILAHDKQGTGAQTVKVITKIEYDDLARLKQVKKQVIQVQSSVTTQTAETIIAASEYDKLGQLSRKSLAPEFNSNSGLEKLTYDYNIRGWLLGMNREYLSGNTSVGYFGMELAYDKTTAVTSGTSYASAQYNGNIAGIGWKSKGDGVNRQYDFGYDKLNRLLKGDFKQHNADNSWNHNTVNYDVKMGNGTSYDSAYDQNGNIKRMQQWGLKLNSSVQIDNLVYSYENSDISNKLIKVVDSYSDPATKLGDFNDGSNGSGDDYTYDGNGNLVADQNKGIVTVRSTPGISYNHLNLPTDIHVDSKGDINYTYDAAGNKLTKTVSDAVTSTSKTTQYIAGMVYENDTLQFVSTEEGRVRFKPAVGATAAALQFDYFIKDHLGNVRMVLTDETQIDMYPAATMETAEATTEETFYSNLPATRVNPPTGYPANTPSGNAKVAKTGAGLGEHKVGPAIILKVMAGDSFNLTVNSWYKTNGASPNTPTSPLSDLLSALASGIAGTGGAHGATSTEITSSGILTSGVTSFLSSQSPISGRPKAYVNWILFDEQFNYVSSTSGFEQVGPDDTYTTHTKTAMPVSKNGFLYIYVSNETPNIPVFFDNLQVTHVRGQILEETHYYPFGLTMAGISSKAAEGMENKEKTFQGQRFDDELDLDWVQFKYRNHDVQIGRFIEVDPLSEKYVYNSPYAFSENKVTNAVELEGLESVNIPHLTGNSTVDFFEGLRIYILNGGNNIIEGKNEQLAASEGTFDNQPKPAQSFHEVRGDVQEIAGVLQTVRPGLEAAQIVGNIAVGIEIAEAPQMITRGFNPFEELSVNLAKTPNQLGREGMEAAGVTQNTQRIPSITQTAEYRIPDGLTNTTLTEVKNVAQQSYTAQIKDYVQYSESQGLNFELHVRKDTYLSKPLKQKVREGKINLKYLPGEFD